MQFGFTFLNKSRRGLQNSNKYYAKTREKPQGVGFIFMLNSHFITWKKPHPPIPVPALFFQGTFSSKG